MTITIPAKDYTMALKELRIPLQQDKPPIETSLFDFFKIGPGPSSSHTMGPMTAAKHFQDLCQQLDIDVIKNARCIHTLLLGSLSATGMGHGTKPAIIAGLLGHEPSTCPANLLNQVVPEKRFTVYLGDTGQIQVHTGFDYIQDGPLVHDKTFSNTLIFSLKDVYGEVLFEQEYYSVGGGFIQWKGWQAPELGKPCYPYNSMAQLREHLHNTGLSIHELILENENSITGISRPQIFIKLEKMMDAMYNSGVRGLAQEGTLPGNLGVFRKARIIYDTALSMPNSQDRFMGCINAYAFAAAEENASGSVIVTAPTCGSAGVMPALLYAMRYDLNIGERALREGLLASAAVGFLAKHNAGIAGAEMGCQGEIGVASAMAAAMLSHAKGNPVYMVENAAEIALEHHLGLTCDPVGGYVQIPCIERNAMGAIKAYNASLLASCQQGIHHMVTLDACIQAMYETGKDMNVKFKETSLGGLAVSMVEC